MEYDEGVFSTRMKRTDAQVGGASVEEGKMLGEALGEEERLGALPLALLEGKADVLAEGELDCAGARCAARTVQPSVM